jgi:hypothetical protein
MPTAVDAAPGDERFDLRGRLGAGGMGTVYRAYDRRLGREVALKILRQASGRDLFRFKREFRALADIVHPNLASLHELHTTGDEWYFTMDLVEGVDFLAWVRGAPTGPDSADSVTVDAPVGAAVPTVGAAVPTASEPAPVVDRGRLEAAFAQLVEGVYALHVAGKLHRDLKPSNVLVTADGRVVLLDFGLISDVATGGDLTHEHAAVGTPAYMAPEQAADWPLDETCDWYAVGVMLYEALTGRRPFVGPAEEVMRRKQMEAPTPPSVIEPRVPRVLDELCMRLLAVAPADRPTGRAILAALGRAPSRASVDLERTQAAAPFVGRVAELAMLRDGFEASRQRGVAVFVRGDSGMGKSQLVRELLDELGGRAQILEGRCYERERVPYKTLDTVIDALTGVLLALPAARLEEVLPRDIAALARLFPVLRRVDAVAGKVLGALLPADAAEVRRRAFAALRVLLRGLAAIAPLVIAIDDLQWGDADSAAFLAELIHHPEPVPLLLVLIHRDDAAGAAVIDAVRLPRAGIRPGDTRVVEVGPLGQAEARQLVRALGGDGDGDALVREGRGHPLFLAELARARGAGVASLEQLITRRIDSLPASAAALLRAVAVAARPVLADQAARAAGLPGLGSELAVLRAERLVRVRHGGAGHGPVVEPYHDRIRAAAVASLGSALPAMHEALALGFEASAGKGDLEGVVEHWLAAGRPERAAAFAMRAGEAAEETLAFHRAAELYALAVQHGTGSADEKRQLQCRRGKALTNAGALEQAALAYGAAAEGAPPDEALDLERLRMEQVLRRGRMEEGVALARALLARIGIRLPLTGRGVLPALLVERLRLRLRGFQHRVRAEAEVPRELLQRVDVLGSAAGGLAFVAPAAGTLLQARFLRLALDAGEPKRLIVALGMELAFVGTAGAAARRRVEVLAALLREVLGDSQDPGSVGFATCCEGLALFLAGRWREALRCMEAGLKLRDQGIGKRWEINVAELYITSALYYLGETRELARLVPLLLRDAVERGDVYAQHGLRGWRSNIAWLVMDRPVEARAHVDAVADERPPREGFHLQHYYELLAQAQIDLYEGAPDAAWRRIEAGWKPLSRSFLLRIQSVRVEATFLRARVALALDGPAAPRAMAVARRAARALEREGAPWATAHALQLRAGIALATGDREAAEAALGAAERACASADMALHAAVLRLRRGELHGGVAGAAWSAEARAAMAAQAIVDPDAMARVLCPWPSRLLPG